MKTRILTCPTILPDINAYVPQQKRFFKWRSFVKGKEGRKRVVHSFPTKREAERFLRKQVKQ